jgi:hypothetical protein
VKYDLIIVSKTVNKNLHQMTENCIASARKECDVNVIVVETNNIKVEYDAEIIYYNGQFSYNRALNQGLAHAKGDIHILANNDILFREGWSKTGYVMKQYGYDSASVLSQDARQRGFERGELVYEGFIVGTHLVGWCIFVTKECIAKIGKLDDSFDFWYSDNVFADQLISHGLKHCLYCGAQVDHITSQTLRTLPYRDQRKYSLHAKNRYNARERNQ